MCIDEKRVDAGTRLLLVPLAIDFRDGDGGGEVDFIRKLT